MNFKLIMLHDGPAALWPGLSCIVKTLDAADGASVFGTLEEARACALENTIEIQADIAFHARSLRKLTERNVPTEKPAKDDGIKIPAVPTKAEIEFVEDWNVLVAERKSGAL